MPETYLFFFRPLLAADKHWAALECYVAEPSQIEAGELATRFVDAGTAALAKSVPLVLLTDPRWLLESEFITNSSPTKPYSCSRRWSWTMRRPSRSARNCASSGVMGLPA